MQTQELQLRPYGYIYKVTNNFNGKCYIGQTTRRPQYRWYHYKTLHCIEQPKLYNALKKYGPNNFSYETIDEGSSHQEQLDNMEMRYIAKYDSMNNGYNCDPGGYGRGKLVSKETREKLSTACKGRKPMLGKKHTEEAKQKISKSSKGRLHTEKTKQKMRGRVVSDETRGKLSEINKGNRSHMYGKHLSSEIKSKMFKTYISRRDFTGYKLITPNKDAIYTENLHETCKLHNINPRGIRKILHGKCKNYKEWNAEYYFA